MKKSLQHGFSLISAIFLLVVIAALGTFAVTLSTTQNQTQTMDLMSARGYQAALTGLEWAAFNVDQQSVNAAAPWADCTTGRALAVDGFTGFTVTVNCTPTMFTEGTVNLWVYDVSAVAQTAGAPGDLNYVEQIATAKLAK